MAKHDKDQGEEDDEDEEAGRHRRYRQGGGAKRPTAHVDEHPGGHAQPRHTASRRPSTRACPAPATELLERHTAARRKRSAAPLGSDEHRIAVDEIGRIEIRIAAVERAMTPPKG